MNGPISKSITLGGLAAIAVPKNTVVYTDSIRLDGLDAFAITYSCACTGTPSVKIEIEQSIVVPTAENAANTNFTVPVGASDVVSNLITKTVYHKGLTLVPVQYLRFKITELTNTVTDTVMTMYFSYQNRFPY